VITATMSITANVTKYLASETRNVKWGGTKRKSNVETPRMAAVMAGPSPNEIATITTPRR
jgi:hypothetical protein